VLYGIAVDLIFTTVFRYVFISSDDQGKSVITVLLDLSTAFDTVDHNVLFSRLKDMFGLSSKVLESFRSVSVLYITTYQMFDSLFKEYRFFFFLIVTICSLIIQTLIDTVDLFISPNL